MTLTLTRPLALAHSPGPSPNLHPTPNPEPNSSPKLNPNRTLTRYYELVDTLLIVLRRKRVILLHGFHHASMPLVMWLCFEFGWCATQILVYPIPDRTGLLHHSTPDWTGLVLHSTPD